MKMFYFSIFTGVSVSFQGNPGTDGIPGAKGSAVSCCVFQSCVFMSECRFRYLAITHQKCKLFLLELVLEDTVAHF